MPSIGKVENRQTRVTERESGSGYDTFTVRTAMARRRDHARDAIPIFPIASVDGTHMTG